MTLADAGVFYDRLPANTFMESWSSYPGADNRYEIRIILLLPDDKVGLTDYTDIRMELYLQAEMVIDRFSDMKTWKQPQILIGGDQRSVEARLELHVYLWKVNQSGC